MEGKSTEFTLEIKKHQLFRPKKELNRFINGLLWRLEMCEFCDGREKRIENGFTYGNAHIVKTNYGYTYSLRYDNSANEYGEGAFEINYCPICGRKLVEDQ